MNYDTIMSVRINKQTQTAIKDIAKSYNMTVNKFINTCLSEIIEREKEKENEALVNGERW